MNIMDRVAETYSAAIGHVRDMLDFIRSPKGHAIIAAVVILFVGGFAFHKGMQTGDRAGYGRGFSAGIKAHPQTPVAPCPAVEPQPAIIQPKRIHRRMDKPLIITPPEQNVRVIRKCYGNTAWCRKHLGLDND